MDASDSISNNSISIVVMWGQEQVSMERRVPSNTPRRGEREGGLRRPHVASIRVEKETVVIAEQRGIRVGGGGRVCVPSQK